MGDTADTDTALMRAAVRCGSAVFLDRDGVLNRAIVCDGKPFPPRTSADVEILPGVPEAIAAIRSAGYLTIVVTNQPDVAKGKTERSEVERINAIVQKTCGVDELRACYHIDDDNCECRKPRPGMLLHAAQEHNLSLEHCYMIGDRWRDIAAGKAAGCKTVWIRSQYSEKLPEDADIIAASLLEAAAIIL